MSQSEATNSDVLIVGGGPVGLGLALDLGLHGLRVRVLERHQAPQRIPKGQNLTQRTGEHFRRWGVSEAIRAASPIPSSYGNEGLTAYGSIFSGYHYDWFKRSSVRAYYAADNERLPQYAMEQVLRERINEMPNVELLLQHSVSHIERHIDGAEIHAISDAGAQNKIYSARFVVGCDGARSVVRQAAGFPETVDARGRRMALLVLRSKDLHDLLDGHFPGKTIFNAIHPELEGYWQFLGRIDLDDGWFFHAPVPDDATVENFDFRKLVRRAVGVHFEAEFEYIGFWDLRFMQADRYGDGRLFIAGDAAHSHPPYGGYGVNTGFEDIVNLGWKLRAMLAGFGGEALLETYTEERHPVFASTRDHFIARMIADDADFVARFDPTRNRAEFEAAWRARAEGGQTEVQNFVPHYAGSSIVWGEAGEQSGATGKHQFEARAGHHLAPIALNDGRDTHAMLGADFTLFTCDAQPEEVAALLDAARGLQVPLKVVDVTDNPSARVWGARYVLVRPDQYVGMAGNTLPASPTACLRRLVGLV